MVRQLQICSRIIGAKPSVASSRISRRGLSSTHGQSPASAVPRPKDWHRYEKGVRAGAGRGPGRYPSSRWFRHRAGRKNVPRFSRTLKLVKICRPSGTRPMPSRDNSNGSILFLARPNLVMVPLMGLICPMIVRTVVVLPCVATHQRDTCSRVH